jgi:spore germination cell wall hydrolase CwlJ-like protein
MRSLLFSVPLCFALWLIGIWDKKDVIDVVEEVVEEVAEVYEPRKGDVEALARLINAEAAGEGRECQEMVANVVVNRMMWYNATLKEIISKPKQFSGYNNSRYNSDYEPQHYKIAYSVLKGNKVLPDNVLYFCNPKTSKNKKFVEYCKNNLYITCENHIFALEQ